MHIWFLCSASSGRSHYDLEPRVSVSDWRSSSSIGLQSGKWEAPTNAKSDSNLFIGLRQVLGRQLCDFFQTWSSRAKAALKSEHWASTLTAHLNHRRVCRLIISVRGRPSTTYDDAPRHCSTDNPVGLERRFAGIQHLTYYRVIVWPDNDSDVIVKISEIQ